MQEKHRTHRPHRTVMSDISSLPYFKPYNWGFNGTVTQYACPEGTVPLTLKNSKETTQLDQFVSKYVPTLKDGARFKLNPMLFTGILQTMYLSTADFSKKFQVFYGREIVDFSDGGVCSADWVMSSWKLKYKFNAKTCSYDKTLFSADEKKTHCDNWPRLHPRTRFLDEQEKARLHEDERPLVVVLHGLAGGSHEPIIRSLTENLTLKERFQVVVLNSRGCARSKITNRKLFTALHTSDIEEFLQREKQRHPNRKIYAIGFSFGAVVLANYLTRMKDKSMLTAAATLCGPLDMVFAAHKMSDDWWSSRLFSKAIAQFLVRMVKVNMVELEAPEGTKPEHPPTVENPCYYTFTKSNLEKAKTFQSTLEFDNMYTAPCLGFSDAYAYYKAASPIDRLADIAIPLLIINSKDDPVVGIESIPRKQVAENPNVLLCETDLGGHLTYMDSDKNSWATGQIAEFIHKFDENIV